MMFLVDYICAALVRVLNLIFHVLPINCTLWLARQCGIVAYFFNTDRRIIAYANLRAAFSGKTPAELKKLTKKIPVVMTSQCIFGRINMNVYSTGRKLIEAGILGNLNDMTTETAFIKLAWLLSNRNKKEVPILIHQNFRNELNKRIQSNFLEE